MNFKLALSGLLSAALLVGCGSAPKLTNPSGEWEDLPFTHAPTPYIEPVVQAIPAPAPEPVLPLVTAEVPAPVAAPPKVHRVRKAAPKPLVSPIPDSSGQAPAQDTKCTAD